MDKSKRPTAVNTETELELRQGGSDRDDECELMGVGHRTALLAASTTGSSRTSSPAVIGSSSCLSSSIEITDNEEGKQLRGKAPTPANRRRPLTLSAAHKQWLRRVLVITLVMSILCIVAYEVGTALIDLEPQGCSVAATNKFIYWTMKEDREHEIKRKEIPRNLLHFHHLPDRIQPYSRMAAVSLCDLTAAHPDSVKPCMRPASNGSLVAAKYIFAMWDLKTRECLEYFDGTVSPTQGFQPVVSVEGEEGGENRPPSRRSNNFAGTFSVPNKYYNSMRSTQGTPTVTPQNVELGRPLLKVTLGCGGFHEEDEHDKIVVSSSTVIVNGTAEGYKATRRTQQRAEYRVHVPLPGLCKASNDDNTVMAKWHRKEEEEGQSSHNSDHHENAGEINDTKERRPVKQLTIHHREYVRRRVLLHVVLPILLFVVVPSLVVAVLMLYRKNAQLSRTITNEKKKKPSLSKEMTKKNFSSSTTEKYHQKQKRRTQSSSSSGDSIHL